MPRTNPPTQEPTRTTQTALDAREHDFIPALAAWLISWALKDRAEGRTLRSIFILTAVNDD
jgi:hypothetical protein